MVSSDNETMRLNSAIQFPGYTIENQLGETHYSSVYRARRQGEPGTVILKVIGINEPTTEQITRFKHENTVIQNLDIDGVVHTVDFIEKDGFAAIVLEDFGGVTLKEVIAESIDLERFLKLAIRLAQILGALHKVNVAHCDIKPSNILLNPESDTIKITDFCISEIVHVTEKIAPHNVFKGTLAYISPEQTGRMNCGVDYRTDLYSLGVTFYEMLTGVVPFTFTDPLDVIHSHIAKQPVPPCELASHVPVAVSDIVMKLMAKSAEGRYQNSFGLAADLSECLSQLQAKGRVEPFTLGTRDFSLRFTLPRQLVGREKELEALFAAYDRAYRGNREVVVVSGAPGSGKTVLVQEIYKSIADRGGYFLSGKFDQFQESRPYSAIVQAFQGLVRQLLAENDDRIALWKHKLLSALGPNGRVITEVIPEIEHIIGIQSQVPELGPEETQNRFNLVFKNFVRIMAERDHPIVLFMDDLQWADSASLNLIQTLLTNRNLHYFLLVGTCRRSEVSDYHPLVMTIDILSAAGVPIQFIDLAELHRRDVNQLIASCLGCEPSASRSLADVVHEKTKGSPLFVHQFLKRLHDNAYLLLDPGKGGWIWDLAEIKRMHATENVVVFMAEKLHTLPAQMRQLIQVCAANGDRFDLETIAAVTHQPMNDILDVVDGLILEGLILRVQNHYRFYHDRIQEAAYSLVSEVDREQLHYRIGCFELQRTAPAKGYDRLFRICDQLNRAGACITNRPEKIRLAGLNLEAGIKAKASTAYAAAVSYLVAGCHLLNEAAWQTDYQLAYTLFIEQMECQFLNRNFGEAERLFEVIIAKAATKLDKAKAYNIMIVLYTSTRSAHEAIALGVEALKIFDMHLKTDVSGGAFLVELIKARYYLKKVGIDNVTHLPMMQDEHLHTMHKLMLDIGLPAFYVNPKLYALLTLKGVIATLKHGLMPHSSVAFISLASIVQGVQGKFELAERIGQMALQLNERFENRKIMGMVQHCYTLFMGHWKSHIRDSLLIYPRVYDNSINSGDFLWAGHSIMVLADYRLILGSPLDDVLNDLNRHQDFIEQLKDPITTNSYRHKLQFIRALKGLTAQRGELCEKGFDNTALIEQFKREGNYFGLFVLLRHNIVLHVLYRQFEKARSTAELSGKRSNPYGGTIYEVYHCFFYAIILISLLNEGETKRQKHYKKAIRRHLRTLRKCARACPVNYKHLYDLVAAEAAGLKGRFLDAVKQYHAAISGAHTHKFLPDEAFAYERFAEFYLRWDCKEEAGHAICMAYQKYSAWGAKAKLDDLWERYPDLLKVKAFSRMIETDSRTTSTESTSGNLDLSTVLQASHIISSEILLDRLLSMTMHTAIASAGAQRGYLLLLSDGRLVIQASEDVDSGEKQVLQAMPLEACKELSHGIVNYVYHSGESLILQDAAREGNFINDPHVTTRQCRSVLCLPILNKGVLTGILYMENNLASEAFTAERIEILKVISAQAAISIQNAQLYDSITSEIKVRKTTEEKYRTILEEMQDAYCEADLKGMITFVNPYFCGLTGYASSEMIGMDSIKLLQESDRDAIGRYYRRILTTGRPGKPLLCAFNDKSGKTVHLEIVASLIVDKTGTATGFRSVARDVTERTRLENNLLESGRNLQAARMGTILGLAKLAECRDDNTGVHLERIREYVRILTRELATKPEYQDYITEEYVEDIYNSAILHDIGKVGVPDAILLKPGRLTKEEFDVIKTHTIIGGDALREVESSIQGQTFLTISKEIAYYHHEKWDGSGYPKGLKGGQIPLSARIVALADVYDALTSKRSYKEAFSHQAAVEIIVKDRGTHFAPDVVDAFLAHEEAFRRIRETRHEGGAE